MTTTWILVADSGRARVFELIESGRQLAEVACFSNPEARLPGKELTNDRLPSVSGNPGGTRHAIEPRLSPRKKSANRFAQVLNSALQRGKLERRYDRLVLVAPSRFLGVLHGCLDDPVGALVVEEVHHDYTNLSVAELRQRLPTKLFH